MMQARKILLARRSLLAQMKPLSRGFAMSMKLREYLFEVFGAVRAMFCNQVAGEADAHAPRKPAEDRRFTAGSGA